MSDFIEFEKHGRSGSVVTINKRFIKGICKSVSDGHAVLILDNDKTIEVSIDYDSLIDNLYTENFYPTKKTVKK